MVPQTKMLPQNNELARLIHPVRADEFFKSYWDSSPLVLKRGDPDYWHDLFGFKDLAELITTSGLSTGDVRVIKDQRDVEPSRFAIEMSKQLVDADKLLDYYSQGATIVINSLQRHHRSLAAFCRKIENEMTHPVQANLYFTPGSAQGFSKHYDTHDVFILQVHGCKEWKIYESPVPLPNKRMPDTALSYPTGKLINETTLEPGDVLYMPRGFVHEGSTTQNRSSIHITLGVVSYTWSDLFSEAVLLFTYANPQIRESLPPAFNNPQNAEALSRRFSELLKAFAGQVNTDHLIDRLMAQFVSTRPTLNAAAFENFERLHEFSGASRLRKHDLLSYWITEEREQVRVLFHGKELRFPACAQPIIDYISRHRSFSVADLPDAVDESGKLTILRRLVKEGFLIWDCEAHTA